jgi:hypothetical protein
MIDTDVSDDGDVDICVDGATISIRAGERTRKEILAEAHVGPHAILVQQIGTRKVPVQSHVMITGGENFSTEPGPTAAK